jgi:translation initiation factor 2 subunit 2
MSEDEKDVHDFEDSLKTLKKSKKTPTSIEASYDDLLIRLFSEMKKLPENTLTKCVLPPVKYIKDGTKRIVWINFNDACILMRRDPIHVELFFKTELATETSIDGKNNLVIKGKYTPTQLDKLLESYVKQYVECNTCKKDTHSKLERDPLTRILYLKCDFCDGTRAVLPIKAGFHATNRGDRRKMKKV